ncbi:MAG: hypothetical protein R3C26_17440 [Calditrichia bacterium]
MFRNYIITAARTLWKNRLFSLVNILGLSVGLSIALVIYLFVSAELSYDKFHVHGDQIYRVLRIGNINGEKYLIGVTSPPYATALETDFPSSVTSAVRVMTSDGQVTYQNHSFREEKFFLADANFFEFFSSRWQKAIRQPCSARQIRWSFRRKSPINISAMPIRSGKRCGWIINTISP